MKAEDVKKICVLGSGIMGHGIAQSFLMGGYPVKLYNIRQSSLDIAKSHIEKSLRLFLESGLIDMRDTELALGRLSPTIDLKCAVDESDFIVEAIPEDLRLKQELLKRVESLCGEAAIIASNTSHLKLAEIFALVRHKERLVGTHWFNPPQIVPAVEIIPGQATSYQTMEITHRLMTKIGKEPIKLAQEIQGFIVNRIQVAMAREVFDLYEKGVANARDIDKALRGSIGFRLATIGLFRMFDLGGLDGWLDCLETLLPEIKNSLEAPVSLRKLISEGHTGIKSGRGIYEYGIGFRQNELDDAVQKRDRAMLDLLKHTAASPPDMLAGPSSHGQPIEDGLE